MANVRGSSKITKASGDKKKTETTASSNKKSTTKPSATMRATMGGGLKGGSRITSLKGSSSATPKQARSLSDGASLKQQLSMMQNKMGGKKSTALTKASIGGAIGKIRNKLPSIGQVVATVDNAINYVTVAAPLPDRSEVIQHTRGPSIFGIWVIIITFGFFAVWAGFAPLNSAANAQGQIILESKKRIIQHYEGGIIESVFVKDGDKVKRGDVLIKLKDTTARVKRDNLWTTYLIATAELARLEAERDGAQKIRFPDFILSQAGNKEVSAVLQVQERIFKVRHEAVQGSKDSAEKQINQLEEQKKSSIAQRNSADKQIKLIQDQIKTTERLLAKGNATKKHLQDLESRYAELEGNRSAHSTRIAEIEEKIGQVKIDSVNFENKMLQDTVAKLRESQERASNAKEEFKNVDDVLQRTEIKASENGIVSNIFQNAVPGAVINQQIPLMEIIPQDDVLLAEVQVDSMDIDVVRVGQTAYVRLLPFKSRIVPVIEGKVVSISADVINPQQAVPGAKPFYKARIEIDMDRLEEIKTLKGVDLYPGMPVQVQIVIGTRTVLKYLLDPITMTFDKAFSEQ